MHPKKMRRSKLHGMPKKLYKYFSPKRWDFFQHLRLRYSQLSAFNDPFEGRPVLTGLTVTDEIHSSINTMFVESAKKYYVSLSEEDQKNYPLDVFLKHASDSKIKESFINQIPSIVKSSGGSVTEVLDKEIGALCLCEERYNLLMWAHYAESHTGFQVEFDPDAISASEGGKSVHLARVLYQERRPSSLLEELTSDALLLCKSSHWSYEREWRVTRRFVDASVTEARTPYPIHLFDTLPRAVTGVVLGARMSVETEMGIRAAIDSNSELSHVRILRAEPDQDHYFLNYVDA